jgi:hypothetical protein
VVSKNGRTSGRRLVFFYKSRLLSAFIVIGESATLVWSGSSMPRKGVMSPSNEKIMMRSHWFNLYVYHHNADSMYCLFRKNTIIVFI